MSYNLSQLRTIVRELLLYDGQVEELIAMAQYEDDAPPIMKEAGGCRAIEILRDFANGGVGMQE